MLKNELPSIKKDKVTVKDIQRMSVGANSILAQIREGILEPLPRKQSPEYTLAEIADFCKMNKNEARKLAVAHNLSSGTMRGKSKIFSLKEFQSYVKASGAYPQRKKGAKGKIVVVASYKGGVTKTTTSVSLAHGLTLCNQKVLLVDMDGQGSATMMMGLSPEIEIKEEDTIMDYIYGVQKDVSYAVRATYWENLYLIPASSSLLAAEYVIPGKIAKTADLGIDLSNYKFWDEIRDGLDPLLAEFDVVIIDTSPSLGYLTQASLAAADGIVMPVPQQALDFASSIQFWEIFAEMVNIFGDFKDRKTFDFLKVFITKAMPSNDENAATISNWIESAYGSFLSKTQIPESRAAKDALSYYKSIFDILPKDEFRKDTVERYKGPMLALVHEVLDELSASWKE